MEIRPSTDQPSLSPVDMPISELTISFLEQTIQWDLKLEKCLPAITSTPVRAMKIPEAHRAKILETNAKKLLKLQG